MEIDSPKSTESSPELPAEKNDSEPTPEPENFAISNLSRVTRQQLPFILFPVDGKYQPISGRWKGEIIALRDCDGSQPAEFFERSEIKVISATPEDNEPEAPEPFNCPEL
jgi:hypothetical protein